MRQMTHFGLIHPLVPGLDDLWAFAIARVQSTDDTSIDVIEEVVLRTQVGRVVIMVVVVRMALVGAAMVVVVVRHSGFQSQ